METDAGATPGDARHLGVLRDHFAGQGVLPSYGEMARLLGYRSRSGAAKLAQRLVEHGFLKRSPGGRLGPGSRFFERTLAGSVRAGAPDLGQDLAPEALTLDRYLIDTPSATVLVRVKGESMRDAGILHGDLAVVERHRAPRHGEFVVALVDGELTLKEYRVSRGEVSLVPHNADFAVIRPTAELEILGVVTGIVRRLGPGA